MLYTTSRSYASTPRASTRAPRRGRILFWVWLASLYPACAHVPREQPSASPHADKAQTTQASAEAAPGPQKRRVIIMVWDGLRPDSVDKGTTPQLAQLRDETGVNFADHHSVFPTFTMMNAAAFATGVRSGTHGFYGNTLYQPGPSGRDAKGGEVDFTQPVYSEDYAILRALDDYYSSQGRALLQVPTLFELAHQQGIATAALGKSGPAFMQDYRHADAGSVILDDNGVFPRSFALELQAAGLPLPKNVASQTFPEGAVTLAADNGDPTAATAPGVITLEDGKTPDPRATTGSPHNARNAYMMRVLTQYILPRRDPALALIWLRNPDSTQHTYGPGSPNALDALRHQDQLLGQLRQTLEQLGRASTTDLVVVSDHGHSSIGADPLRFPLRALDGEPDGRARIGAMAQPGYIVSGDVHSAEWLRRAGFPHTYDGADCTFDPVMSGIKTDGKPLYPTRTDAQCEPLTRYTTPSYRVPDPLPEDAIVIAANGGSEYFYVPGHDPQLLRKLVSALQERDAYGAIFVRQQYGELPGTLPLSSIGMEGPGSVSPPTPDLVVSFAWDKEATSAAGPQAPGTELSSAFAIRGMHGSFSPRDVHNTLIAAGPHFRAGFTDHLPTSNLDVAPTVASLLGLTMPQAEGRVLLEALSDARERFSVEAFEERSAAVPLARVCTLDDLECKHPLPAASYSIVVSGRALTSADGKRTLRYIDCAEALRVPR